MPRAVKIQGYEIDSAAQEALKEKPPFWVKITDVFGETLVTTVIIHSSMEQLPRYHTLISPNYGSHHAAEAVIQSTLKLQKEYIKIDPVALFPDWENRHLMLPEPFVEPMLKITCSILKENPSSQETDSQILDTLSNRLQREWRFSRVGSQITVYLTSGDGAEETKKLGSLVPPGFRLITCVERLHRNLRDVEQRTLGCIRTPVSEAKTQRRFAGHPYPIPYVKEFEVLPLWKDFASAAIKKRVQDEISSKLVRLVQGELVSYQLTTYGVQINAKNDAPYRRLYNEYNGRVIDATDAELYSLQFKAGSQAPTNAHRGAHPPPSNHTETSRRGKSKQGLTGIRKGDQARGEEEALLISPRSYWRLGQQARNPGKPWVKTPWRTQDEPLAPTSSPRDYDVPIPTNIETLQKKVAMWNAVNQVPQPREETRNAALSELPTEEEGLAVMAQMRAGTANPYQLVRELSKMGKRIGPYDAAIYWLMLRVRLGKIMIAVRRIERISSVRRKRICEDLKKMVDRPATVLMDYAADVYSLCEFGIVTFEEDGTWLWGDPDVVYHRLPKVLRIPVIAMNDVSEDVKKVAEQTAMGAMHPPHFNVRPGGSVDYDIQEELVQVVVDEIADVVDPMEDVLWLSDAPGSKGPTLDKTHTGPLVINIMRRFLSDDESFTVEPLDFHGLDPRHRSNIIVCTTPEIIFVIDGIKPYHIFIIIMGSQVALHNAVKHLFGGNMKAEDVRFFEPYPFEYNQIQRIVLVIPHPGVHNYVPFAKWTKEAFAQGLARICLIAATVKRLKPSTPDSHDLVSLTLASVKSSALNASLSTTLSLYGIRAPWNGATASKIGHMMDYKNTTFEQALSVVSPKKEQGIITSLTPPTPDHPRNDAHHLSSR